MTKETKTMFKSIDGLLFESETACANHELEVEAREKATTYWSVVHSPDLTEGRGYSGAALLKVYLRGRDANSAALYVRDYCVKNFGLNIQYVMGVSPMFGVIIAQVDKKAYGAGSHCAYCGDYKYPSVKLSLIELAPAGLVEEL